MNSFDFFLILMSVVPELNWVPILALKPLDVSVSVSSVEIAIPASNIHHPILPEEVLFDTFSIQFIIALHERVSDRQVFSYPAADC